MNGAITHKICVGMRQCIRVKDGESFTGDWGHTQTHVEMYAVCIIRACYDTLR